MLNLGFERLESELGCIVKKGATPKDTIIVVAHVDDLLSVWKRKHLEKNIENGESVLFLGDYITKYKDEITLKSKDAYVVNMLAMLGMECCKPTTMVRKESADIAQKVRHADVLDSVSAHPSWFTPCSTKLLSGTHFESGSS